MHHPLVVWFVVAEIALRCQGFGSTVTLSRRDHTVSWTKLKAEAVLEFSVAEPDDIPSCHAIESVSYPSDEAASLEALYYRQQHAKPYFQVAKQGDEVIGFVCGTRCEDFTAESMSKHEEAGDLLAIHSVVVHESYRRKGVASKMLQHYLSQDYQTVNAIVLLAKSHLLGFYVQNQFRVIGPSPIVHGQDLWYELEYKPIKRRPIKTDGESWYVKTEQFCKPFPVVKPHLAAHREWVRNLRRQGCCITSGYRVDKEGKPGGGGLMFLAAKSFDAAKDIVMQDPLVANECVDWELNGWIGEVGDVELR